VAAARGTLLGLVLGDAIGATAGLVPDSGVLQATSGGQLTCFTVDGLIRADVSGSLRHDGHAPTFVWHAYGRWAAMQGIIPAEGGASSPAPVAGAGAGPPSGGSSSVGSSAGGSSAGGPSAGGPSSGRSSEDGGAATRKWPDGWLADVAVLKETRGAAPATLAALRGRSAEPQEGLVTRSSLGPRAVIRTLPAGLYARAGHAAHLAAEIAALTHRDEAVVAAAVGAMTVQLLSEGAALDHAVATAEEQASRLGQGPVPDAVAEAVSAGRVAPRESAQLARFTADPSATSALAGGLYVAASYPEPDTVRDALLFAASAGDGGHVATVTGALLGAAHGPDALPVSWLSRLELVWVADTLARDLVRQLTESPAGSEYAEPTDPHWWNRYPGW
jgi:ADP-ribosylglycohydrolase